MWFSHAGKNQGKHGYAGGTSNCKNGSSKVPGWPSSDSDFRLWLHAPLLHAKKTGFSSFPMGTLPKSDQFSIGTYPLVTCYIAIENGPVEICDLPIKSMVIFQFATLAYQRVWCLGILTAPWSSTSAKMQWRWSSLVWSWPYAESFFVAMDMTRAHDPLIFWWFQIMLERKQWQFFH